MMTIQAGYQNMLRTKEELKKPTRKAKKLGEGAGALCA
jgi:hypothetical protein